jgi:hypothetical protein
MAITLCTRGKVGQNSYIIYKLNKIYISLVNIEKFRMFHIIILKVETGRWPTPEAIPYNEKKM